MKMTILIVMKIESIYENSNNVMTWKYVCVNILIMNNINVMIILQ